MACFVKAKERKRLEGWTRKKNISLFYERIE
jgi:hypothetical protein